MASVDSSSEVSSEEIIAEDFSSVVEEFQRLERCHGLNPVQNEGIVKDIPTCSENSTFLVGLNEETGPSIISYVEPELPVAKVIGNYGREYNQEGEDVESSKTSEYSASPQLTSRNGSKASKSASDESESERSVDGPTAVPEEEVEHVLFGQMSNLDIGLPSMDENGSAEAPLFVGTNLPLNMTERIAQAEIEIQNNQERIKDLEEKVNFLMKQSAVLGHGGVLVVVVPPLSNVAMVVCTQIHNIKEWLKMFLSKLWVVKHFVFLLDSLEDTTFCVARHVVKLPGNC